MVLLDGFAGDVLNDGLRGDAFQAYVRRFGTTKHSLEELLASANAAPLEQRRPILLQGELANPYRLRDINMGPLPLLTVRLRASAERGLTDWTQGYLSGVHHVTLARTPGWWERLHIGLATKEQLKLIRDWLDNGVRSTWRPVKLAEGGVRFEHDAELTPPSSTDVEWDGSTERVSLVAPAYRAFNGAG